MISRRKFFQTIVGVAATGALFGAAKGASAPDLGGAVYQLSTPWDLYTATVIQDQLPRLDLVGWRGLHAGLLFSPNGRWVYIAHDDD